MKNRIIIPTVLFVIVLAVSVYVLVKETKKNEAAIKQASEDVQPESQIILFYGDGCPHCAIVDGYLKENNVAEQITFSHKEIFRNRNNAKELEEKAKICGIPTNSIGVPFLWDGKNCYVGDQDVIDFFKQKINNKL